MKNKSIETNMLMCIWLALITSCASFVGTSVDAIPTQELIFPKAEYYNALIRANDNVIVLVDDGNLGDLQSYAREGDQEFTQIVFPDDSQCDKEKYYAYETLPDGRLQIWKLCPTQNGTVDYLMAYDWSTRKFEELAGPLPLGSSGASWNPDQTKAIAYLDGGFATKTIYWISNNSFSPLDLVVNDKSHSWNLQDDFPDFKADDTGKTGTTGRAAWSPDGNSIAFFASPDAIGKTGSNRFGVEFNIYLMNPTTLQYQVATDNVYSPFLIQWSPDSMQIAFIGKYGSWKEEGIWLYSPNTNSVTNIARGKFQSILWTSDGKSLVAISCKDSYECSKIYKYDITHILEP